MDLIDRYLHEVGRYLPAKQRDDIVAELGSLLEDSLENRVGDDASEEDVVEVLKEFGSPQKVAASYYPEEQYLIGPALFPTFRMVVDIALLVLVVVHLMLVGVLVLFDGEYNAAIEVLGSFIGNSLSTLGVIVIAFYVMQRFGVLTPNQVEEWDPRSLPKVTEEKVIKRSEVAVDVAFSVVLLVLLLFFRGRFGFVITPGTEVMSVFDPVIAQYFWLIIFALLVGIGVDMFLLWRGRWDAVTRSFKIGGNLLDLLVVGILIVGHQVWLTPHTGGTFLGYIDFLPQLANANAEVIQVVVTQSVQIALVVIFIVVAVETVSQVIKVVRDLAKV